MGVDNQSMGKVRHSAVSLHCTAVKVLIVGRKMKRLTRKVGLGSM